ncbi:MAG: nuclear transport factor 2 family protein [Flavobacteriales bacterium]
MQIHSIIPALTYNDAPAAVEWLSAAFGFEKHLVVPGENGTILHAELILGNAMVMLGSTNSGSEYAKVTRSPAELGYQTQSPYVVMDDPDALYAKAVHHGARMVIDLKDEPHGGRGFTCADPEGHLWSFGSYDPWKETAHCKADQQGSVPIRIAHEWFNAFNAHDLEALLALYADDAEHYSPKLYALRPATNGMVKGKAALRDWWRDAFHRLPTLRYELKRLIADKGDVFMEYTRQVEGEPALNVGEVLQLHDGVIVASRVYHG